MWRAAPQVHVTAWRAQLWVRALQASGAAAPPPGLGEEMQACFDETRMRLFRWADGVPALVEALRARGLARHPPGPRARRAA